ncbi:pentapeptide repeat-containing protein [Amycolatopsis magusensis]|uniref:Uncharacterized protein YjbI with pentapeptide repeats n=1 Tax=Amycolatopsis magusensis TaxID=882444 RepID=A0ABS4PX63_9PSEU|nr:pentapeptide repeat-containing protein [Amycolatopsis magusensis]MBP2183898.1 uncharacterized protein YjbI with pentapeptide repeats [Amycolatopsis magusensis]
MLAWLLAAAGLGMAVWMASSWAGWSAVWVWLGRWWMVPVAVLLLAAAAALAVLRSRHPSAPPRPVVEPGTEVMPALTPRAILLGALVLLGLGVTGAVLLLINFSGTEPRDRLDAIRTAATLLVGTGGAAALLLAARRQRATELTLAVQRRTADATERDAAARRITELYLQAVEQLGSDKAAVRHGGLYALERVAQDNPDQRQTVINVICAYLRSPYTSPPKRPASRQAGLPAAARRGTATGRVAARAADVRRSGLRPPTPTAGSEKSRQEREVRLTAQRILTTHLTPGRDRATGQPANPLYWAEGYDLDLTGATLIDFHATDLTVRQAVFIDAHFSGTALFGGATFTGIAWFDGATFTGIARFYGATFSDGAWFDGATFTGLAEFDRATFTGSSARFERATFTRDAWFDRAAFAGAARFNRATFTGTAKFRRATFTRDVRFGEASFTHQARFDGAAFTDVAVMTGAAAASAESCVWPTGWTADDHRLETAASGEAPGMLRLVPVPVVLAELQPNDGLQSGHGASPSSPRTRAQIVALPAQ